GQGQGQRRRAGEAARRGAGRVRLHLRAGAAVQHRLPEGVRRAPAAGPGGCRGQVPRRGQRPLGHGAVRRRRELEAAVGLRARAGDDAGAARRTVRGAVLRPQRRRPRDRRQRRPVGGAGPCLRLFQQDRVLLLHRAGAAARRIARHAGALHRGSGPAGQHPHADALVYLLQERIADRRARRVLTPANGRPTMAHPSTDAHAAHDPNVYYVPHGSRWPLFASVALFITMVGFSAWLNEAAWGKATFFIGIAGLVGILFKWFADVITESVRGYYNKQVDGSFRMGMIWFIFSEVMFFGAFF